MYWKKKVTPLDLLGAGEFFLLWSTAFENAGLFSITIFLIPKAFRRVERCHYNVMGIKCADIQKTV